MMEGKWRCVLYQGAYTASVAKVAWTTEHGQWRWWLVKRDNLVIDGYAHTMEEAKHAAEQAIANRKHANMET